MEAKPGWQSSEMWITVVGNIVALCVATGILQPAEGTEITKSVGAIVGGILSLITVWKYVHDRTSLKVATMDAQVAMAKAGK